MKRMLFAGLAVAGLFIAALQQTTFSQTSGLDQLSIDQAQALHGGTCTYRRYTSCKQIGSKDCEGMSCFLVGTSSGTRIHALDSHARFCQHEKGKEAACQQVYLNPPACDVDIDPTETRPAGG